MRVRILVAIFVLVIPIFAQTNSNTLSKPAAVVSIEVRSGIPVYRVNGQTVEDKKSDSLILRLSRVLTDHRDKGDIFIVVDQHARVSEIGKLNTALDKVGANNARRVFLADFERKLMSEISISESSFSLVLQ